MAQEAMEAGGWPPAHMLIPKKDKDGVWRLTKIRHRTYNGNYVRTSGAGRTQKECRDDWKKRFEVNRHKGSAHSTSTKRREFEPSDKMSTVFDAFITAQERKCEAGKIASQTLVSYRQSIYPVEGGSPDSIKLMRELGNLTIAEVGKPKFLADYLEDIADASPGYAARHHLILTVVFKMLTLAGLFDFSPMAPVPQPGVRGGGQRALTADERDALYDLLLAASPRTKYLRPLTLTLLGTGIRPGEALALRWMDIDGLDDPEVVRATAYVCGTLVSRGGATFRQPRRKCGNSYYLTLPTWLTTVLRAWKADVKPSSAELPVFESLRGGLLSPRTAETTLKRAREGSALEWVKFGNMRDTVATHVTGVSGDPKCASAQLGHSEGASLAMRHYIDSAGYRHPAVDNADALELLAPSKVTPK
ncbi:MULTISPECIES: tyrosine-type recombinase/integrase [Nocardia]|uniref:tyrosine-type recombinase/integrase n=1 Tax=Nocardia TaxID=1817 RepID=UPI00130053B1|nr:MULTISPECIES: tyrosine-type recombinase/integrase [Nocardia]